jgi:hypothetical protein
LARRAVVHLHGLADIGLSDDGDWLRVLQPAYSFHWSAALTLSLQCQLHVLTCRLKVMSLAHV